MKAKFIYISCLACLLWMGSAGSSLMAQGISAAANPNQLIMQELEVSEKDHSIQAAGKSLSYKTTAGFMHMSNEGGKPKAKFYFTAYTLKNVSNPKDRPITFVFNGGPGSSSVWLHMGGLGPRMIEMTEDGEALPPPYNVIDNPNTWLDKTDLVFIDPIETGYSRPAEGEDKKQFLGYVEDIASVGDFIRAYVSEFKRWNSPKFLSGESYGTTRAAGLSGYLQDRYGMFLNGIIMISAVTNFATLNFAPGHDLPYIMYLPTYAAIAEYHKALPNEVSDLDAFIEEVRQYAKGEYATMLMKGDQLTEDDKLRLADKLHQYTGLSKEYLENTHYRIHIRRFVKELLRDRKQTVGRLDGRILGLDLDHAGEGFEFDPSYNKAIYGPYSMAINDYVSRELGFESNLAYEILTGRVRPWNYSNVQNEYLNNSETLRNAIHKNPYLKVMFINGYYDLATPFFATEYTVDHMMVAPELRDNISMKYYESGHMVYIHKPSLDQMTKDVRGFYEEVLKK
ncbi:S10 family peptidase [Arthrospiribacter ruber]|uniref:Peptidase S10 n=1 Tax=Arthrospiribacter ruber TaxID=2487934 RepID=A0A951MFM1_9BACT|nr:peptidase S10 [Arthrospiribacter ruber]MBW3468621.1 peptidase S10 [Arthrospiribacter ruber]